MSTALLTRTVVAAAYLLALLLNGPADAPTGLLAAAVIAVWTTPLLRDCITRRTPHPAPTGGDSALRLR
jgi:hypothetical protein